MVRAALATRSVVLLTTARLAWYFWPRSFCAHTRRRGGNANRLCGSVFAPRGGLANQLARDLHPQRCAARKDVRPLAKTELERIEEVKVRLLPGLSVSIVQADRSWQRSLNDEALDALEGSGNPDPHGTTLWASAQVLAQALVSWTRMQGIATFAEASKFRVLELGAGCGLVSLTAAKLGLEVIATDFKELPLQLVQEAARRQGLKVQTQLFDLLDHSASLPLPPAELVVCSDMLYKPELARALARRVAESRSRGSEVIIADQGRAGRPCFMRTLRQRLPPEEAQSLKFAPCWGVAVRGKRGGLAPFDWTGVDLLGIPHLPDAPTAPEGPDVDEDDLHYPMAIYP